jgi:hypothetical protein
MMPFSLRGNTITTNQGQALVNKAATDYWKVTYPLTPFEIKVNINKEARMENKKFKIASIEYDGFVDSLGQLFAKITDIHNVLGWDDLPDTYLRERPFFYRTRHEITAGSANGNNRDCVRLLTNYDTPHDYDIFVNDVYSKDIWEKEITPSLLEAGKRLSKILFVQRWCGKHILKI